MKSTGEAKRLYRMMLSLGALMALALCALPVFARADQTQETVVPSTSSESQTQAVSGSVSGSWGSCAWEIVDGVLTIHPGEGVDQVALEPVGEEAASASGASVSGYVSPWASYDVTSVRAVAENDKRIVAPANCARLFSGWTKPEQLKGMDLSGFDVGKATNMTSLFEGCTKLETLNISGWKTSKLESCEAAFKDCKALKTVDISGWTNPGSDNRDAAKGLFSGCVGVESIKVGSAFQMHCLNDFPSNSASDKQWYSTATKALYTRAQIMQSRQKLADEYTSTAPLPEGEYTSEGEVSWTRGSTEKAVFVFHHSTDDTKPYRYFKRMLMDKVEVSRSNYSRKSGSLVVSFEPTYLMGLSVGTHKVTAEFGDGSADATLTIEEAVPVTYNVTVSSVSRSGASGAASASPTSGATGTVVNLTANPGTGSELERWEILSGSGATLSGNKLTIGDSDVSVRATFKLAPGKEPTYKAPEMGTSAGGRMMSRSDNVTYTISQKIPEGVTSVVIRFDLDRAMQYVSSLDDVLVSVGGTRINATKAIDGQLLTVSVGEATTAAVSGQTVQVSFAAKVREDADLTPYLNAAKTTASIPYMATTTFQVNGVDAKSLSSNKEHLKVAYSSGSGGTKRTTTGTSATKTTSASTTSKEGLAKTFDPSPAGTLAAMALSGAGLLLAGRRRRR